MRLGDLDALHDHVMEEMRRNPHCGRIEKIMHRHEHESFLRDIRLAPTIDAVLVAHGRWINKTNRNRAVVEQRVDCSACGHIFWHTSAMSYNYCPNCGARMDGADE